MWHMIFQRHMTMNMGDASYIHKECGKNLCCSIKVVKDMKEILLKRNYECKKCGKALKYYSSLQIHTGEKPCECEKRSPAFISSNPLQKHERTHWRQIL